VRRLVDLAARLIEPALAVLLRLRAHALTLPKRSAGSVQAEQPTTMQTLIRTIVAPYEEKGAPPRIEINGSDVPVSASLATGLALLLHEFATNGAKYGALSTPSGRINITCSEVDDLVSLTWTESGGPRIDNPPASEGFGSQLAHATITGRLGGTLSREWNADGLTIRLSVARHRLVT